MTHRRSWQFTDGMLLIGLCALAVVAMRDIWADIFTRALNDPEQSHVLLAPVIVVWLIWVRRGRARFCKPEWSMLGPLVALLGWGLAVFGFTNSVQVAEHLGAVLTLFGGALTIIGPRTILRFAPAAVALLFLLPVPGRIRQEIAMPLQEISAAVGAFAMDLFGIPVERMGSVLLINGQEVAVAEACNGMRMVAALLLVSYAFVFSIPMRQGVRIFIVAVSPLVAILVNVLRLIPTVMMYGYSTPDLAEAFHDISGWAMLLVALGILWLILRTLRWIEVPIEPYAVAKE